MALKKWLSLHPFAYTHKVVYFSDSPLPKRNYVWPNDSRKDYVFLIIGTELGGQCEGFLVWGLLRPEVNHSTNSTEGTKSM